MSVPVMSANLYVKNKRIEAMRKVIRDRQPVVVGLQEARVHLDWLDRMRGYTLYAAEDKWGSAVPVLLSRRAEYHGHGFHRMHDRIGERHGYDSPRWLTHMDFGFEDDDWTLLNAHPNVVSREQTPNPRTVNGRAYATYSRGMWALARAKREAGRRVLVVGDLNDMARKGIEPWEWRPDVAMKREGFTFVHERIDYIGVNGGRVIEHDVIGEDVTGSDHPWLHALVSTTKRKR